MGRKKTPHFRVVVADSASPRDGRFVETLGYYKPLSQPARLVLDLERVDHWLSEGASPSGTVRRLITKARKGGDESVALGEEDAEQRKAQRAEELAARRAAEKKKEAEAAKAAEASAAAEGATEEADEATAESAPDTAEVADADTSEEDAKKVEASAAEAAPDSEDAVEEDKVEEDAVEEDEGDDESE